MKNPCGNPISPLPKLLTSFPSNSIWRIGSRSESAQPFAPHRSRIHKCLPSGSIRMPLGTPIFRPWILSQLNVVRYGFEETWALNPAPDIRANAVKPTATVEPIRVECDITLPPASRVLPQNEDFVALETAAHFIPAVTHDDVDERIGDGHVDSRL